MPLSVLRDADRLAVGLFVLIFILAGLAFSVATPLFQNPDEPTHVDMARYYAHHLTDAPGPSVRQTEGSRGAVAATGLRDEPVPPSFDDVPAARPGYGSFDDYGGDAPASSGCPTTCQNYQYAHPPGWYLLVAPVVWLDDHRAFPAVVLALRIVDVFLASALVWSAWYVARQLWPSRRTRALVAAALTATFAPMAGSAASANNDALVFALMAVTVAMIARVLRRGTEPVAVAVLGVAVGAGLLTKGEFLAVAPIAFVAVVVAPSVGRRWKALVLFATPALIGALWWLRVVIDTHSLTPAGSELVRPPSPGPWRATSLLHYAGDRLPEFFNRFPGFYGWGFVSTSVAWRAVLYGTAALAAVGWLVCRRWQKPSAHGLSVVLLAAIPVALLAAALWSSYSTFHASGEIRGMAPRYVYGALPVFAVALVAAGSTVAARLQLRARWVAAVIVLVAAAGTVVEFVEAMKGQYATASPGTMLHRAGIVSPVTHAGAWITAIALAWVVCVVAAAWLVTRDDETPATAPVPTTRTPT